MDPNKYFSFLVFIIFFNSCQLKSNKQKLEKDYKYTNTLINESSPYLLQHAHNPVNWYPWDQQYLDKAKQEGKLVLLSIGYSSCHWCHVMEKETFEDEEVAKFMNTHFINIKIDREEYPNVDKTYITAVQVMTGNAGWPLNCVILPNGKPVWGGTYFRKHDWLNALEKIHQFYIDNPDDTESFANQLTENLKSIQQFENNSETSFSSEKLTTFINDWQQKFDTINGGFIGTNQFPRASNFQFLLRHAHQTNNQELLKYVNKTLIKIANGGLQDHLEGGFARYTVDNKWHIPHFEKMLYDNAQLVSLFSYAYQITQNKSYKDVVFNTLAFLNREFYKEGLYFSSLNADSVNEHGELEEGAYYTWKKEDLAQLIINDFDLFKDYFGIDSITRVENKHALVKVHNDSVFLKKHKLSSNEFEQKYSSWQSVLLKARKKKEKPTTDYKILTSWNALLLQAYTDAYKVFNHKDFRDKAIEIGKNLKNKAIDKNGELLRSLNSDSKKIKGYAEDYAWVIHSFISLYQVTLDDSWLHNANELTKYTLTNFLDEKQQYFNYSSKGNQQLITNNFEIEDIVIPSSNSVLCKNLFYLGHYFDNQEYLKLSKSMLKNMIPRIKEYPHVYSNWLDAYSNYAFPYFEVVICGENALIKTKQLQQNYIPNYLLCGSTKKSDLPLLKNRFNDSRTLIYVCVNKTCKLPTKDIDKAISQIR